MKTLRELLTESSTAEMPTGNNAMKASNHIVKHYKGRRVPGHAGGRESNPYSSHQSFSHVVPAKHAEALKKHLSASSWHREDTHTYHKHETIENTGHRFTHADGGHVTIKKFEDGRPLALVTVHGKKKAKRPTLPYYD